MEDAYRGTMRDIAARGYARTECSTLSEQRLADGLAMVKGNGMQRKPSSEDPHRFGATYTLKHIASDWASSWRRSNP